MTKLTLFVKSIWHYRKINFASLLAAALCVSIITGALIIGDSIKYSLQQITLQRLGNTTHVLNAGDKIFSRQLASGLANKLNCPTAPVFQAQGIASTNGGQLLANKVQILGIDSSFFQFAPNNFANELPNYDEVFINEKLASKLQLQVGDFVLLKIEKYNEVSLNSPFINTERNFVSLFVQVKLILNNNGLGRFNLRNDQISPYNVFLNINQLNKLFKLENAANIVLISNNNNTQNNALEAALKKAWKLADVSISIKETGIKHQFEITDNQIFIKQDVINAANKAFNNNNIVFTYLVNSIEHQNGATPYSFVSALQSLNLSDNQIIINQWLANDLKAAINDSIALKYYTVGPYRRITEKTAHFKVKEIADMQGFAADRSLMPAFPGLSNVENCRDWNAGVHIDLKRIRKKDEVYWDNYRGTPKAFISYNKAHELWSNNFGQATAIRFTAASANIDSLGALLLENMLPAERGLQFIPVKQLGIEAVNNATDFSQLFLGMSFFILVAALLLIGLFFHLNTKFRSKEMGFYLAAGFRKKSILKFWLSEGIIIIIAGSIIGLAGAIAYNQLLLKAINSIWIEMVKTNILFVKINPSTLAVGAFSGALCAFFALFLSIKSILNKSVVSLLKNESQIAFHHKRKKINFAKTIIVITVVTAVIFTILYFFVLAPNIGIAFFVYGILLLIAGIAAVALLFGNEKLPKNAQLLSLKKLYVANIARNKKRSLIIVSMLAIGVYLVISTGANRQYMIIDALNPKSGTGAFMFYAQTTMPVIDDLNVYENKVKYGIEQTDSLNIGLLQLKSLDGDEASCFNLNQVQQPHLLGVDYNELAEKKLFSFANSLHFVNKKNPWTSLGIDLGKNTYPAIADQTVIQWSFGKKIGDTLFFQNENGDTVNLVLVAGLQNSIFQGNLLISDSVFKLLYPSIAGSKIMLINGPAENASDVKNLFEQNFRDYGIELIPAPERLASFYSVQNTYLNVFVLLGGIGLIIGTLGFGIIIFRTVLERKHELGILRALGFRKTQIFKMLIAENSILLLFGITIGCISAIISTLPAFMAMGTQIPVSLILNIIIVLFVFGLTVVVLSILIATKSIIADELKRE